MFINCAVLKHEREEGVRPSFCFYKIKNPLQARCRGGA